MARTKSNSGSSSINAMQPPAPAEANVVVANQPMEGAAVAPIGNEMAAHGPVGVGAGIEPEHGNGEVAQQQMDQQQVDQLQAALQVAQQHAAQVAQQQVAQQQAQVAQLQVAQQQTAQVAQQIGAEQHMVQQLLAQQPIVPQPLVQQPVLVQLEDENPRKRRRTAKANTTPTAAKNQPGIVEHNTETEEVSSRYWRDAFSRSAANQDDLNMRLKEASKKMDEQRLMIETLQCQVLVPQNTVPVEQLSNNLRYSKKPNDVNNEINFSNSYAMGGVGGTPTHPSVPQGGQMQVNSARYVPIGAGVPQPPPPVGQLPNLEMYSNIGVCTRNPCQFATTCWNAHVPIGNRNNIFYNVHKNFIYRGTAESILCSRKWSGQEVLESRRRKSIDRSIEHGTAWLQEPRAPGQQQQLWAPGLQQQLWSPGQQQQFRSPGEQPGAARQRLGGERTPGLSESCQEPGEEPVNGLNRHNFYDNKLTDIYDTFIKDTELNDKPKMREDRKVSNEVLNVYAANCRSIVNKKKSVEEIFTIRDIDIGILCELNTKNPPKIKGYQQFKNVLSSKKTLFHHICIYVKNKFQDKVLRVPDESNLEIVHLIIRHANPPLHIIGTYLDGERGDREETTKICSLCTELRIYGKTP